MMKKLLTVLITAATMVGAMAEVPSLINYQGRLKEKSGTNVNGTKNFTVRIFDAKEGGKQTYEENIGPVVIKEGAYSFGFGEAGESILDFGESLIVEEDGKQIFDYSLSKTPVAESLSIQAGNFTWSEKTGSSDSDNLLVQYDKNNKSAKIIFLNSSPGKDSTLKFDYRVKESGVMSGLASSQNNWLEITVAGETLSPRERLVSVPFALIAKTAVNVLNPAKSIGGYDQHGLRAVYSLENGNAWPPTTNFLRSVGATYMKEFYLVPGKVEVQIYIANAHLYANNSGSEEYIKNLHIGVTLQNINPSPFNIGDVNASYIELSKKTEELIDAQKPGSRPGIKKTFIGDIPIGGIYRISFQSKPYYPKDSQRIYIEMIYVISLK